MTIRRVLTMLALAAGAMALGACTQAPAPRPAPADDADRGPRRFLFYGSSSTYYHDFYKQVGEWVARARGEPQVVCRLIGKSGTGVDDYLRPNFKAQYGLAKGQTPLGQIAAEKPDAVLLQVVTYFLGLPHRHERFANALADYSRAARDVGARVYLYEQGWGTEVGPDVDADVGVRYEIQSALQTGATIVPCRRAWVRARAGAGAAGADLRMHDLPDTGHPGLHGLYLNLCLFHAAMTGTTPVGLPAELRHKAFEPAEAGEKPRRGPLRLTKIDPKVARYLQTVAWKAWWEAEAMMAALRAAVRNGTAVEDLDVPWPPTP